MSTSSPYRYILRYLIDPEFNAEDRISELVAFCKDSQIEEVMLFVTPEELTIGHPTMEIIEKYAQMGKILRQRLADEGIDMSLNPWTTTYHVRRGRRFLPGQSFQPMVGETGMDDTIAACPLCPNWQEYLCETFGYMVREMKPVALWVEDDWRLHNHEPEMKWGGCFCSLHLQRFSEMVGQAVTRQQVLDAVLAPGTPHPWRKLWLELWRDTLLEPAWKLRDALAEACPDTKVALMSSVPDVHSAEGRDWHALQDAFNAEGEFLIRPHLPPYTETPAISTLCNPTRLTIANLKRPLLIYPELENSPRNGVYTKSRTYSIWECLESACYGSHGITINHYDMMGNGIALDPDFGKGLARAKPRLNAVKALGIDDQNAVGPRVLFRPDVAEHRHTESASEYGQLINNSDSWSVTMSILGISHGFTSELDYPRKVPLAVSDQTLWALSEEEIEKLLSGPVLLDGCSVAVLVERGFGNAIGVKSVQWGTLNQLGFAYESICQDDPTVFGLANPRMTAQRCAVNMLKMELSEGTDIRSWICKADHERLMPGMVLVDSVFGGKVAMQPYPFRHEAQFLMGYFNVFRRRFLQDLVAELSQALPVAMVTNHPMHVFANETEAGTLLAGFNVVQDAVDEVTFAVAPGLVDPSQLEMLNEDGSWSNVEVAVSERAGCGLITVPSSVSPLEGVFLLHRKR